MVKEGGFLGRPQKEELWGGKRGGGGGGDQKKKNKKGSPVACQLCVRGRLANQNFCSPLCLYTVQKKKKSQ